jgi:hypothetical protein
MNPEIVAKDAFDQLLGPARPTDLSMGPVQAKDFLRMQIKGAIGEIADEKLQSSNGDVRLAAIRVVDDSYIAYLQSVYDAVNTVACLNANQQNFVENLMAITPALAEGEITPWEHAAMVATYINSCSG